MNSIKYIRNTIILWLLCFGVNAQNVDSVFVDKLFREALKDSTSYKQLKELVITMPGRLCGSKNSTDAVLWTGKKMMELGADTVYKQELMVRNWKRGKKEIAYFEVSKKKKLNLEVCSFGLSVPTVNKGLSAKVIEVDGIESLKALPDSVVKGKIVFYNRKMNPENYYSFMSYGEIAAFRSKGVFEATAKGAAAILARSSTLTIDPYPHTGVMRYTDCKDSIPALSICTRDAEILSQALKVNPDGQLKLQTFCKTYPDTTSYNMIGEIKGTEFPDKIILVGGHIDCWDNSQGAHDDGAGCVTSMEVIRLFKKMNYKPRHTIRIVMFMDEEVAQRGAKKYAELAKEKNEIHIAAIESDRGGATPLGFSADMDDSCYVSMVDMVKFLNPWGIWRTNRGGSGVDITPLKPQGVALMAIVPDPQRYFEYHHCANDSFDKISQRELQLSSASLAAMIYLIDKYEWNFKIN